MAITASQITSSQTLEEFRLEFNKLQNDVTTLASGTMNANLDVSGTLQATTITATTAVVIPDAGNIGSASDTDAIAIASTGAVTFSKAVSARKPIKTEFNASGAVTASLTTAESGATVLIHGTENNVINLPAAATTNPGLYYDFIIMTAVASGKSTIVNIAGSGGNFVGALSLAGGTAANAVFDNAGDAFTFVASTVVGSRARITCLTDDGTDGVWQIESVASPIATID